MDVSHGDGRRILAECLERTARLGPKREPLDDELNRYGAPQTVQPRLGQGTFRIAVTSAHGACAVSGEHSLPALADDFHNGREYERFAGRAITVPLAPLDQPDPELLDWHAAEVFRGERHPPRPIVILVRRSGSGYAPRRHERDS